MRHVGGSGAPPHRLRGLPILHFCQIHSQLINHGGVAMQASESKFFYGYRRRTLDRCKKKQPSKVENLGSTSSSSLTQELLACCYCWKQIALNVVGCFNETQFAATGYPMIIAELQSDEVCLWFLKQIWGKKFVENLRVQCVGKIL